MTDHFYLISNASTETYVNTLTKFTNHFDQNPLTLDAESKWQIGLESIYIHPRFTNIPMLASNAAHMKVFSGTDLNSKASELRANNLPLDNIYEVTQHQSFSLPYKHYTPVTLIDAMNEMLIESNVLGDQFKGFAIKNDKFTINLPERDPTIDVTAYIRSAYAPVVQNHVVFQTDFAVMLGFDKEKVKYIRYTHDKIRNVIKLKDIKPKVIKVELNNVQPIAENDTQVRFLSYHTINMITDHLHYVQFDNPLYLTLLSSVINEFTVRLLDENNNQLQLTPSLPTILKMSLRPFNDGTGEFNIVIDSTKKNPNYPNNTGTDFCFNLSPMLQLDDDYICSINSITYSTFFKTLPIPSRERYIRIIRKLPHMTIDVTVPFNPKNKPFFSIQDILNILNEDCKISNEYPQSDQLKHPLLEDRCAKFVLEEIGGVSYVNITGFPETTYDLPHELITVLGDQTSDTRRKRWVIQMDTETTESGLMKKRFIHPPDIISLIPQTLFVYADFIQPVMVGDSQVNLLQIIPVRSNVIESHKNTYITEEIKRPNWSQIKTRTLDKLSFKILRSDGKEINFHNKRDGVIITLTFKKMQRAHKNVMFW